MRQLIALLLTAVLVTSAIAQDEKGPTRPRVTSLITKEEPQQEEAAPKKPVGTGGMLLGMLRQLDKIKGGTKEGTAFQIVISNQESMTLERYWLLFDSDQDLENLNSKLTDLRSSWVKASGKKCFDHAGKKYFVVADIEAVSPDE